MLETTVGREGKSMEVLWHDQHVWCTVSYVVGGIFWRIHWQHHIVASQHWASFLRYFRHSHASVVRSARYSYSGAFPERIKAAYRPDFSHIHIDTDLGIHAYAGTKSHSACPCYLATEKVPCHQLWRTTSGTRRFPQPALIHRQWPTGVSDRRRRSTMGRKSLHGGSVRIKPW